MTSEELQDWLCEHDTDILLLTGFDAALIGTTQRINEPVLAVYDWKLIVEELVKDGCSYEEAVEYVDFNVTGAWVGPQTPLIVNRPDWIDISVR